MPSAASSSTFPTPPADRGRSEAPIQARMMVTALPTLPHTLVRQQAAYKVVDRDVHLDVAVPQLPGAPGLNRQLRADADTAVRSFRRTLRREASKGPGRYHAMTVGWQVLGRSKQTIGIQLWVAQQHGLRVTIDRRTVWYDTSTRTVLTTRDLFTPAAWPAAQKAISGAVGQPLSGAGPVQAALADRGAPGGKAPAFGFTAAGDLAVTFGPHALPGDAGPVSVRLDGRSLDSRLSAAGRSARSAAGAQPVKATPPARVDCAKRKCVALTFDDGPGPYTAELVALLQQRKVPATFFVVGNRVALAPDLLAAVDGARMEVGNHSLKHDELTTLRAPDLKGDLETTSRVIAAVTGRQPDLLRPPYGSRNQSVDAASKQLGMAEVLWDVDTLDWLHADAARVQKAAVRRTRRGSIILMHDVFRTSVAAVPGIIDDLRRRGYTFVTVSQLLRQHPVPGRVYRQQGATRPTVRGG